MPEHAPTIIDLTEINGYILSPDEIIVHEETKFFGVILGEEAQPGEDMYVTPRFSPPSNPNHKFPDETSELELSVSENFRFIQLALDKLDGEPGFVYRKLSEILITVTSNALNNPLLMTTLSDGREI